MLCDMDMNMDMDYPEKPENTMTHSLPQPSKTDQEQLDHGNDKDKAKAEGVASFLPPSFSSLEEYLACLQSFLDRCEPITSLMIVDYFTTNSWEARMPQEWREAFESEKGKLSSLDLMELVSIGKLRDFNAPPAMSPLHATSVNKSAHPTPSSTEEKTWDGPQDWPESLKDFVRMVKALSINRTLDPDYAKFKDTLDIHLIPGMSPKKLHEVEILSGLMASYAKEHSIRSVIDLGAGQGYLSRVLAFQHQLCVLGVDSNTIQTCGAQTTQKRTEKLFVNKTKLKRAGGGGGGGGNKKATAKQNRSATSVAPQSSSSSPSPAVPSSPALSTALPGGELPVDNGQESVDISEPSTQLSTALSETEPNGDCAIIKACKKLKTEGLRSRSSSPADTCGGSNNNANNKNSSSNSSGSCKRPSRSRRSKAKRGEDVSNIPSSDINPNASSSSTSTIPTPAPETSNGHMVSTATPTAPKRGKSNTRKSTSTLTTATDVSMEPAKMDSANDPSLATTPGSNFQLQHITHHITAATLPTLLKEHFPKKSKATSIGDGEDKGSDDHHDQVDGDTEEEEGRWTLCGLHACGDLTSNMIKLYLESSATCLFSVGCCYHWITERYDNAGNIVISDGTHGFPLSAAFNQHKTHLGEHAKMIACQSPERWLKYQKETEDAIHGHYFRALLHKLMVERGLYPGPPTIAPVLGRMGKHRLKGFPHYLSTALHRLRLPTDVIRPEEAQAAYEEFLEKDLYRIGILWALRTMLGPLFEGMILLDRATYLYENVVGNSDNSAAANGEEKTGKKGSVQLVAGFDVVESPRNMILIALKD
ncbi:Methyltransferase-like protein 25 [Mortierella sp. GBA30]|nr:Methyltransferase-like protein 25 [Mortierella sp. GBA30]